MTNPRFSHLLALVAVLILACPVAVPAQQDQGQPTDQGAEAAPKDAVDELAERLSLSEQQEAQVRAILARHNRPSSAPAAHTSTRKGADLTTASPAGESADPQTPDAASAKAGPNAGQRAAIDTEIMAVLTPAQRQIYLKLKANQ